MTFSDSFFFYLIREQKKYISESFFRNKKNPLINTDFFENPKYPKSVIKIQQTYHILI